jgi:hypothetical protein
LSLFFDYHHLIDIEFQLNINNPVELLSGNLLVLVYQTPTSTPNMLQCQSKTDPNNVEK